MDFIVTSSVVLEIGKSICKRCQSNRQTAFFLILDKNRVLLHLIHPFAFQLHEPDPVLRSQGQLSFEGFARYLMDSSNDAISKHDCDSLDMPLSRYYIATSHNTYLAGHQLKGQSSVELYREVTNVSKLPLKCVDFFSLFRARFFLV